MNHRSASVPAQRGPKRWLQIAGIAAAAIIAGLLWPRLLSAPALPPAQPPARGAEAGSDLSYTPPNFAEPPEASAILLRLGGTAVILLGGAIVALWYGKRWLGTAARAPEKLGQHLKLLDSLTLGNRCHLHLLQVDQRQVLVGIDMSGLQSIVPLPESFASALAEGADEPTPRLLKVPTPEATAEEAQHG